MSRKLVAYFSASGVTAKVAERLADTIDADIFEIQPAVPYTEADLDWRNKESRSSIEMNDLTFRPRVSGQRDNMEEYDIIFVGFPIWWYIAPTIINTFLETYDFSGKTVIPFATSGGSGMGNTNENLSASCPNARILQGKVFKSDATASDFAAWVDSLNLEKKLGKQCLCIYTRSKPPISASAETGGFLLVGVLPRTPQITKSVIWNAG